MSQLASSGRPVPSLGSTPPIPLESIQQDFGTFIYGTFPLFLGKALGGLMGMTAYGDAHIPGRLMSALADLGTVALTIWIGYRLFGRSTGLLAGLLLAATMLHIQSAHFFTVDAVATCFTVATFAFRSRPASSHAGAGSLWPG